jgi:hypothetical protein
MGAMEYELTGTQAISKSAAKKEAKRERKIENMTTSAILWFVVTKHKFVIVCVAFGLYVTFSLFGTLIVGLMQGFIGR